MDYLLPTALDVPPIETAHVETPSPLNPLGVKGVGEAGAIPVAALYAQAIEDALGGMIEIDEMPMSPRRLFELMVEASSKFEAPGSEFQVPSSDDRSAELARGEPLP
jgi:aerobic carbon-monoxide dehydrogenase large subunit